MERREKQRFKTPLESRCCGSWPQWDGGDSTCLVWRSSFLLIFFFFIPLLSQKTGAVTPNSATSLQAKIQMVENRHGQVEFAFASLFLLKDYEVQRQARAVSPFQTFSCCVCEDSVPARGACGGGLPVAAADWHAVLALPAGRDVLSASAVATECETLVKPTLRVPLKDAALGEPIVLLSVCSEC